MQSAQNEVVVIFGESQWPHIREIRKSIPEGTTILRATSARSAFEQLAEHLPCRVTVLTPPDIAEMVRVLHGLQRKLGLPVSIVDPSDEERVERFCRLAGCTEYHSSSVEIQARDVKPGLQTAGAKSAPDSTQSTQDGSPPRRMCSLGEDLS